MFAFIIASALFCFVLNFIKKKKEDVVERNGASLSLWWLCCILFFGNICFLVAMVKQFPNHDYYFIDTFFLPILLFIVLSLNALPKITNYRQAVSAVTLLILFIVFMLKDVKEMQVKRRAQWHGPESERTIRNYRGAEQYLDSLNISKDAKILTLYAYPQNTPFILMNRKGYTEMYDKEEMIKTGLSFDYDYLVVENEILERKLKENKDFLSDLKYYSDNGNITIFMKKE